MTIFHVIKYGDVHPFIGPNNIPKIVRDSLTEWHNDIGYKIHMRGHIDIYLGARRKEYHKLLLEYEDPI
jgi:hypothetical protein